MNCAMNDHFIIRVLARFRPLYGWLPFLLLGGTLINLGLSVVEVGWVPNDSAIIPLMAAGFLASALLAQRATRPAIAWALLGIAGIALAVVLIGELWPPSNVLRDGQTTLIGFWRLRIALFIDRIAGWLSAVRGGERTTETMPFALGLAAGGWFIAVLLAWSAYRLRRPFLGLSLVGAALAANTFYGLAGIHWAVFFFGLAIPAGTYLMHLYREAEWEQTGIDYPADVRTDLLLYTGGISLGIMALVMTIPSINFESIAAAFQRQDAVVAAEETLARAFAGLPQPRVDYGTVRAGGLPRSFLLGSPPELLDTVVMTATYRADPPVDLSAYHWRSVSFDVYTGRGWQRSPEREETLASSAAIPLPDEVNTQIISIEQAIDWVYDNRTTRYTLGRPAWISHDLIAMWRGRDDLVGVRGTNNAPMRYTAGTLIPVSTADQLRSARLEDVPPEILGRYTALPDTVPERVRELAASVARHDAGEDPLSPYEQARALESFLRQYPYSLDLPVPPEDSDLVDYFLFDLQTGFCDYYASAMVVMARTLGIPARLGVGFRQQPPDETGVQIIRQRNAHSWAEVYFAGFGWIEFEPTAPFAGAEPAVAAPFATGEPPAIVTSPVVTPVAIPDRAPRREVPWLVLVGLVAAALVGWRLWGRRLAAIFARPDPALDPIQLAFAHLQDGASSIGRGPHPAQTPAEFTAYLLGGPDFAHPDAAPWREAITRLAELFNRHQYGRSPEPAAEAEALDAWNRLRRPLRRLAWRRRLGYED